MIHRLSKVNWSENKKMDATEMSVKKTNKNLKNKWLSEKQMKGKNAEPCKKVSENETY